jgi:hypothetical protein
MVFVSSVVLATQSSAENQEEYKPRTLNLSSSLSESARARIISNWSGLDICLSGCANEAVFCLEQIQDPEGGPPSCWEQHQQCDFACFEQFPFE